MKDFDTWLRDSGHRISAGKSIKEGEPVEVATAIENCGHTTVAENTNEGYQRLKRTLDVLDSLWRC